MTYRYNTTGITSSGAEINILDGCTATFDELNYLADVTLGTAAASKALTISSSSAWTAAGMTCANLGTVTTAAITTLSSATAFSAGLSVKNGAVTGGFIDFYEDSDQGSNYVRLSAPTAVTATETLYLPDGDGTANQVMETDGNGVLSWTTVTASALAADDLSTGDAAVSLATSSGDITLDTPTSIILDAGDGEVYIKDDGATHFEFDCDTTSLTIYDDTDTDDYFKIQVAALGATTLSTYDDNSGGSSHITLQAAGNITLDADGDIALAADGDQITMTDGSTTRFTFNVDSTPSIDAVGALTFTGTSDMTLDAVGDITLDADGGQVYFKDDGTTYLTFNVNGSTDSIQAVGGLLLDAQSDFTVNADSGNIIFQTGDANQLLIDMDSVSGEVDIKLGQDADDLVFSQFDGTEVLRLSDEGRAEFGGAVRHQVDTITGNTTLNNTHHYCVVTAAATISLPEAAATNIGLTYHIKRRGSGTVTIEANGSDLIDNSNTDRTLTEDFQSITIFVGADANWYIV